VHNWNSPVGWFGYGQAQSRPISNENYAPLRPKSCYTNRLTLRNGEVSVCLSASRSWNLRRSFSDVAFPPGDNRVSRPMDATGGKSGTPLQAEVPPSFFRTRSGKFGCAASGSHDALRCNRSLRPAEFPIDSSVDLFYRPPTKWPKYRRGSRIDEGEGRNRFYEVAAVELKDCLRETRSAQHADATHLPRRVPGPSAHVRPKCNLITADAKPSSWTNAWSALKKVGWFKETQQ